MAFTGGSCVANESDNCDFCCCWLHYIWLFVGGRSFHVFFFLTFGLFVMLAACVCECERVSAGALSNGGLLLKLTTIEMLMALALNAN